MVGCFSLREGIKVSGGSGRNRARWHRGAGTTLGEAPLLGDQQQRTLRTGKCGTAATKTAKMRWGGLRLQGRPSQPGEGFLMETARDDLRFANEILQSRRSLVGRQRARSSSW